MTAKSKRNRLCLYIGIAVIAAAQNGSSVHFKFLNWETFSYFLSIISAALATTRAFIDKSSAEVEPDGPQVDPPGLASSGTLARTLTVLCVLCACLAIAGCVASYKWSGKEHEFTLAPQPEAYAQGMKILREK